MSRFPVCDSGQFRGMSTPTIWTGNAVGTTIAAAEVAIAISVADDPAAEPWCGAGDIDPPHTCPAKAGEDPR